MFTNLFVHTMYDVILHVPNLLIAYRNVKVQDYSSQIVYLVVLPRNFKMELIVIN